MQYTISAVSVLLMATGCFLAGNFLGYKMVALLLLMTVSLLAMLFDILPVLVAAILSALVWNYFFIPPVFTFHIDNAEDVLMFLLYFFIALVNAVLTFKIRKEERKVRDREEKEHTIKLYTTLLNSLSHELRTPIATIIGAVDTLQDQSTTVSAAHQTELLNQIDQASVRLNRQVENLLNMNRLETGILKLNLDWCDTNELIHAVIQKLPDTQTHTLVFVPDEHLPLYKYDRGLIEQVLQNLIHNAINYTPAHTRIDLRAWQENDHLAISVADEGLGIAESEQERVFEKFYRLPHAKASGSGLGLSIVKGFVEAHRGHVRLERGSNGGAVFTVTLPVEASYLNNLKNE